MRKNKPFAYSNENSLWVAFFYAYSNPFNTKSIEKDFLCDLKDNGINLSNGYMLYNPHYLWLKLRKEKIVKKTEF
ncbi:MAG: hypothetical protein EOP45_23720 [Sphingobacteriaceae bacterium]|nr:MAG: hypothetical protein EOP45_23720 [Sphingobacteriaceae bacterium]